MQTKPIIPLYGNPEPVLTRSHACVLWDSSGKQYIDFESGVWCSNLGHSAPGLKEIFARQFDKSVHNGYKFRSLESELLAEQLHDIIGFRNGQSAFLCSGSEAVNLAIKIGMHLTEKRKVIKIDNSYLSAYGFGRIGDDNVDKIDVTFNSLEAVADADFSQASCVVIEVGGASVDVVRFPNKEFIDALLERARRNNCLVIANEVTTGLGRTGKWFGYHHYDFQPDIVVTGKGLGNGYPVSAVSVSESIVRRLESNPLRHAQSHQNDPLGCAIASEVIKIFRRDNLVETAEKTGRYFHEKLSAIKLAYPDRVKEVRGRGLMLAIEFFAAVDVSQINQRLFDDGFVVGFKNKSLRFMPPLTIGEELIDNLVNKLAEIVGNLEIGAV